MYTSNFKMMLSVKTMVLLGVAILQFGFSGKVVGQIALPYFSGFDNALQSNGWAEYKTAATQFSHWSFSTLHAYSNPNGIGHDYSPSTGITLTDNWFVSPPFSIPGGGRLDSIRYKFSGFSSPEPGDTIGLYMLTGAQDPGQASSATLLFDFRGADYITDNIYRLKRDVSLPASNELAYLAIRYRNTDCSVKWLAVSFDNVAISESLVAIPSIDPSIHVQVFPNPTYGNIMVRYPSKPLAIGISDEEGQRIRQVEAADLEPDYWNADLSNLPPGMYWLKLDYPGKMVVTPIVLIP